MREHDLEPQCPNELFDASRGPPASDLKRTPLWREAATRERDSDATLPRSADVVIIGAGYTGLSCALALAWAGRSVTVITLAELAQLPKNDSALRSVART